MKKLRIYPVATSAPARAACAASALAGAPLAGPEAPAVGVTPQGITAAEVASGASAVSLGRRGRPALAELLTPEQLNTIRRIALDLPLRTDVVSHSLALRLYAERREAAEWLRTWAASRGSKHHIPRSIMERIRIAERLVAHHQAPGREHLRHEAHAPGTMRLNLDGTRLLAGQVESWDDASVNFLLWTELDGEVRCGRFQLLLGVDHATDYVTGCSFVARPRDSYRAEDVLARALIPTWTAHGAPERVVLERGVWEARRVNEALQALGVARTTSYHPRTKLVESVFHRLWTRLGGVAAGVGRSRGEDERGNLLLREIRAGRRDARRECLSLTEARAAVAAACAAHNRERIEGRYGRWVPEERWQAEAPQHLRRIDLRQTWAALPERRPLVVRAGGMVVAKVTTEWELPLRLEWAAPELWRMVGRGVICYFDPAAADEAVVVDRGNGAVLARPKLISGNAHAAMQLRRAQTALVRAEHAALAPRGQILAATSDLRDAGRTVTTTLSRAEPAREDGGEAAAVAPGARGRSVPVPAPDEIDLAALEAAEARAREAGLLPASW